jgi:tRNA(fMet)-specific endonuclease VapC
MEKLETFAMKILLDTNIIIDYLRKKDKVNAIFSKLSLEYTDFYISTITEFEVERGLNEIHLYDWKKIKNLLTILSFDSEIAIEASGIYKKLKLKNKLIDTADLLIAATAKAYHFSVATLNRKDFESIEGLDLILVA